MSADAAATRPTLLHVVDGAAGEQRIRRVERMRRETGGHVIVMGGLDEECRCAEIGLITIGSAPHRSIASTVRRTRRAMSAAGAIPPLTVAWSDRVGLELAAHCPRVVLVAEGLPDGCRTEHLHRLEVIAPEVGSARAWSLAGVAGNRIVPPCALPAAAPVDRDRALPTTVLLLPDGAVGTGALELFHRVGLAHLGGAKVLGLLDPLDPGHDQVTEYGTKVGITAAFDRLEPADSRPRLALVATHAPVEHDERILDLMARGIGVIALVDPETAAGPSPMPGLSLASREDPNSGAKVILEHAEDLDRRTAFQTAAFDHAATRGVGDWARALKAAIGAGADQSSPVPAAVSERPSFDSSSLEPRE